MECELCGREGSCKAAVIDGVEMMVCINCLRRHGVEASSDGSKLTPVSEAQVVERLKRIKKIRERNIYEEKEVDRVLVRGWNDLIKKAREEKKLTREELGSRVNVKTSTMGKIENGDLRPPDKVVEKLEKILKIRLFEEIKEETPGQITGSPVARGLTIGDLIDNKKKN